MIIEILVTYFTAINVIAFSMYGYDKKNAEHDKRRVPESSLHLIALLGGTIGAFMGPKVLHHKTQKKFFQFIFWGVVVLQVGVIWILIKGIQH